MSFSMHFKLKKKVKDYLKTPVVHNCPCERSRGIDFYSRTFTF